MIMSPCRKLGPKPPCFACSPFEILYFCRFLVALSTLSLIMNAYLFICSLAARMEALERESILFVSFVGTVIGPPYYICCVYIYM